MKPATCVGKSGKNKHTDCKGEIMSFIFYCPHCAQKIECEDKDNEVDSFCPCCGETIFVKKEETEDQIFTFNCPNCNAAIKTLTSNKGNVVKCPGCNRSVVAYIREKKEKNDSGEKEYRYRPPVYKAPVLAEVFIWNFIFHIFSAFVALLCIIYHFDRGNTPLAWGSVVWLVTAISAAVFCYGIAEFIRFIGRISDNSDAIREFVEKTYYKK